MDDNKKKQVKQSQCCASRCQMSPPVDLPHCIYMRFHCVDTYAFGFTFSDVYVHALICAIVDVGKIGNQLSKYSAKLADVRKLRCAVSVLPLMNLSNLINPASVLYTCIPAYIRAYTYLCMTLYVYVYTYMNLSNVINTVCVLSYAAYLEILWLLRWKVVWKCSRHLGLWFLKCQTKSLID